MKKFLFLIPAILIAQSCSSSLSEGEALMLEKKFKPQVSFYQLKDNKVTTDSLKVGSFKIIEKISLSDIEEEKIEKDVKAARAFGAKGYDLEIKKYIIGAQYLAPEDGMIVAGTSIFKNKATFEKEKENAIKNETHERKCAAHSTSWGKRYCVKYNLVKVENYDQKLKELQDQFANFKVMNKGDVLLTKNYEVGYKTESMEGKSQTYVHYKKIPGRSTASK